ELITRLRTELDAEPLPLLRQAEGYRAREVTPQQRQAAKKALRAMDRSLADAVENELPQLIHEPAPSSPPPTPSEQTEPPAPEIEERLFTTSTDGMSWEILLRLTENGNGWISVSERPAITDPTPKRLVVEVNMGSPLMLNFGGRDAVEMESVLRV